MQIRKSMVYWRQWLIQKPWDRLTQKRKDLRGGILPSTLMAFACQVLLAKNFATKDELHQDSSFNWLSCLWLSHRIRLNFDSVYWLMQSFISLVIEVALAWRMFDVELPCVTDSHTYVVCCPRAILQVHRSTIVCSTIISSHTHARCKKVHLLLQYTLMLFTYSTFIRHWLPFVIWCYVFVGSKVENKQLLVDKFIPKVTSAVPTAPGSTAPAADNETLKAPLV